jgi:hypothetical protein
VENFYQLKKEMPKEILRQRNALADIAGVERKRLSRFKTPKDRQMVKMIASNCLEWLHND